MSKKPGDVIGQGRILLYSSDPEAESSELGGVLASSSSSESWKIKSLR